MATPAPPVTCAIALIAHDSKKDDLMPLATNLAAARLIVNGLCA
jgi:methylglyoxal synthase